MQILDSYFKFLEVKKHGSERNGFEIGRNFFEVPTKNQGSGTKRKRGKVSCTSCFMYEVIKTFNLKKGINFVPAAIVRFWKLFLFQGCLTLREFRETQWIFKLIISGRLRKSQGILIYLLNSGKFWFFLKNSGN